MKKAVRFAAVVVMTVAAYATVSAPKTEPNPVKAGQTMSEGSAPVPMCRPGTICD